MNFAKTSPPALPRLFARTRLFELFDQYRHRQGIWIQGQAGAGKTTLVAGYLHQSQVKSIWYRIDAGDDDLATFFHYFSLAADERLADGHQPRPGIPPESLLNPAPFTRLFCRELFARLPKPLALVFDNLETIAPDSPLHQVLAAMLGQVPQGITLYLISRRSPPALLSRRQLNRSLALVEQSSLRCTDEEALGLAGHFKDGKIPSPTIQQMNTLVDGWIAGLVLFLEHGGTDALTREDGKGYFYTYFATEIFAALDADSRQLLLHTACLNTVTPAVARELTGIPHAEDILKRLSAHHYFTEKSAHSHPAYQYHPLFRDFLLRRSRDELGAEHCRRITTRAAEILADAGETEEAVPLAIAAADWPLLSDLLNRQAPVLLAQQRFQLLAQWLTKLPGDLSDSSPWLQYWWGCCRLPFDPRDSCHHFALAHAGFAGQEESDGQLRSACGAILAILTEWDDFSALDRWIAALDAQVEGTPPAVSAEAEALVVLAMLGALLFRQPQHPAMVHWEAHAERLIRDSGTEISLRIDIGNVLVHWQYWKGDLAAATHTTDIIAQLVEAGGSATLPRLFSAMNQAIHDWHTADFDHCLASITDGLALAAEMDIHLLDDRLLAQGVYASLAREDFPTARRLLDQMKPVLRKGRRLAISHYHYLCSNYHLITGELELARHHGQRALEINAQVGTPFPEALAGFTLAQIDFAMGEQQSAANLLARGQQAAREIGSRTLELLYELISGWCCLQLQQNEAALCHLRRGLTLQRRMGFSSFPGWRNTLMKPLLLLALEQDIEPVLVAKLIEKHGLRSAPPPQASAKWPWPIKIFTLGRFSLLIDGKPLPSSGRAQQKPLELLKVLIAFGGREVSKDRLLDILWQDTDGDRATRALDTTLHRLRKLVGHEQVIQVQDRKLSLNAQLCWVDVWVLERLLGQMQASVGQAVPDAGQAAIWQQHLLSLYQGGFLKGDDEPDCLIGCRDRLHRRVLDRLDLLARQWEELQEWQRAVTLYQQLLELDDGQEQIYRRLISCYHSQGRTAEAIATYQRCRKVLSTHYGIPPSAETETLYQSLR